MKRLLLIGAVFCTAALFGLGISLFLPADAYADPCDRENRQDWFDCPSAQCPPNLPNAKYDCGTLYGTGGPCDCYFIGCYKGCPNPI
jgi:hypothetical protein